VSTPPLNEIMEFDHVVTVHADGTITDGPREIYAPELFDNQLDSDRWELLNGYSGQHGYSGPIMHNSEFIGGRMEDDIRSTPGTYVALVSNYPPDDDSDGELVSEGWAVARLKA
jgi:hypothetical protein